MFLFYYCAVLRPQSSSSYSSPLTLTTPPSTPKIICSIAQTFTGKSTLKGALFSPSWPPGTGLLECDSTHSSVWPFKRRLKVKKSTRRKEKEYKKLKLPAITKQSSYLLLTWHWLRDTSAVTDHCSKQCQTKKAMWWSKMVGLLSISRLTVSTQYSVLVSKNKSMASWRPVLKLLFVCKTTEYKENRACLSSEFMDWVPRFARASTCGPKWHYDLGYSWGTTDNFRSVLLTLCPRCFHGHLSTSF